MKRQAENGKMPEKKFAAGSISATIWQNVAETKYGDKTFYSVSFQRSFKEKQGNWQTSSSLGLHDIPKAQVVLQKAYEYLVLKSLEDIADQPVPVEQI